MAVLNSGEHNPNAVVEARAIRCHDFWLLRRPHQIVIPGFVLRSIFDLYDRLPHTDALIDQLLIVIRTANIIHENRHARKH